MDEKGIKWTRGLFRLWLVLSLAWAGTILSLERPDRVFQAMMADNAQAREYTVKLESIVEENDIDLEVEIAAAAARRATADRAAQERPTGPWERYQERPLGNNTDHTSLKNEMLTEDTLRRAIILRAQVMRLEERASAKRERLQVTAGLALFPPGVLFLVGAALLWALRGFRRDD